MRSLDLAFVGALVPVAVLLDTSPVLGVEDLVGAIELGRRRHMGRVRARVRTGGRAVVRNRHRYPDAIHHEPDGLLHQTEHLEPLILEAARLDDDGADLASRHFEIARAVEQLDAVLPDLERAYVFCRQRDLYDV